MLTRIKNIMLSLTLVGAMASPMAIPMVVHAQTEEAQIQDSLCAGASLSADQPCDTAARDEAQSTVSSLLTSVINIFSLVVGVVSVIMIIIGGFKYITSGGESANVSGAKNTILYAIIGLVVVALAQIIVRFVLAKVNQATSS
jgi:cytochrome bd-type quinol oxidase subunit 2